MGDAYYRGDRAAANGRRGFAVFDAGADCPPHQPHMGTIVTLSPRLGSGSLLVSFSTHFSYDGAYTQLEVRCFVFYVAIALTGNSGGNAGVSVDDSCCTNKF